MNRKNNIQQLKDNDFDVVIIGSGINGATSAAALSAKGYKVALIDKGDFAGETSMHSSNLVWGGIKYMENHEFSLVYHLCKGRNELLKAYPSQVKEVRFLTNIEKGFRHPRWFLYLGTWAYWLMGLGFTKIPQLVSKKKLQSYEPAMALDNSVGAFEYSDAYLYDNDSRFVLNFVKKANEHGGIVTNYMSCEFAEFNKDQKQWQLHLEDKINGERIDVKASCVINATGPFLDTLNESNGVQTSHQHLLSQGIHILVNKITEVERVLTFFADDGRLFFAIPMGDKTCIGTTDHRVSSSHPELKEEDVMFVLDNINKRLNPSHQVRYQEIIATRNGVRPLALKKSNNSAIGSKKGSASDAQDFLSLSRKHVLDISDEQQHISIFGGKLTDCVNVGEEVVEAIAAFVPSSSLKRAAINSKWYGEPSAADKQTFIKNAQALVDNAQLSDAGVERLWRRYGLDANTIIEHIQDNPDLGKPFLQHCEFLAAEFSVIKATEMVVKLEDFIRRRSKLGLIRPHQVLSSDLGLMKICEVLFEKDAKKRYDEYINNPLSYVFKQ